MKNEIRNVILIAAFTFGLLYLAKPKQEKSKYKKPEEAKENDNQFANAQLAIESYRLAKKDNASTNALNELNRELLKEFKVRVVDKNGQLVATDRNGIAIAEEKK